MNASTPFPGEGTDTASAAGMDRRQFLFGGALLSAVAAGYALQPRRNAPVAAPGALERAVPKRVGAWDYVTASGLVVPPQDEISERIYDQVLTRIYASDSGPPMMLLIAYGSAQDYGLQVHLPEVCYPSSGYSIESLNRVPVNLRPDVADTRATVMTAERGDRVEQVFYWMRIGDRFPSTALGGRTAVLSANVAGSLPDGVLVRVSTLMNEREPAMAAIRDFHAAMLQSLGRDGRRLLLGV